jgi:hypothetical protein
MNQEMASSSPASWDAPSFVGWRRRHLAVADGFAATHRALQATADSR